MKSTAFALIVGLGLALFASGRPAAAPGVADSATTLQTIGPLTFGPNDVLFAADGQAATIYALTLGTAAAGGAPGTMSVPAFDQKIAALLGTTPNQIAVTDLAVHPRTHN